jgi:formylglycine-generating enzyme required for sulfatase activity
MKKTVLQLLATSLLVLAILGFKDYDSYKGFSLKAFESSLAEIPTATFRMGVCEEDLPYIPADRCRQVKVDSFYISKYEVSNGQYVEFLEAVRKQDTALYTKMLPDTLVWREKFVCNEPYVEYYLRHQAYSTCPVVGVSYEQAETFCSWLTKRYQQEPKRKFEKAVFRLPTEEQWVSAARGGPASNFFPWKGMELQNKKGELRANFSYVEQYSVGRDTVFEQDIYGHGFVKKGVYIALPSHWSAQEKMKSSNPYRDILLPVSSLEPGSFGLYNMAGNVEEFVRPKGKTHGGSWRDPGYYLLNIASEKYDTLSSASVERGFRFVMEKTE